MSPVEVAALAFVAAWLAALTLLVLVLVRQLGLISVRLATEPTGSDPSLSIGTPLPEAVTAPFPVLRSELAYLVFLSSTCGACPDFARDLSLLPPAEHVLIFVAGVGEAGDRLADLVPSQFDVIRDPVASAVAEGMRVRGTPIALQVEKGILTGRAIGTHVGEIRRLFDAYSNSDARQLATSMREVLDSAKS